MAAEKKQAKKNNNDGEVKRLQMQNERLLGKLAELNTANENLVAENNLLQKENKILSDFAGKAADEVQKVDEQHSDELKMILGEIGKLSGRIDKVEGKKA